MTYTVRFKRKNGIFWRKLKRVKGDYSYYVYEKGHLITFPIRVFTLDDETRHEFPMLEYQFKFSKERYHVCRENLNKDTGK